MKKFIWILSVPLLLFPDRSALQETVPAHERTGRLALEQVGWDWKPIFPNWRIVFHKRRPGLLALTDKYKPLTEVWVRPDHTPEFVAAVISHELGHAFDLRHLTDDQRKTWSSARGIPDSVPWYSSEENRIVSDYYFGYGDFAECFMWTVQGPAAGFKSELGPEPTAAQQELILSWLSAVTPTAGK